MRKLFGFSSASPNNETGGAKANIPEAEKPSEEEVTESMTNQNDNLNVAEEKSQFVSETSPPMTSEKRFQPMETDGAKIQNLTLNLTTIETGDEAKDWKTWARQNKLTDATIGILEQQEFGGFETLLDMTQEDAAELKDFGLSVGQKRTLLKALKQLHDDSGSSFPISFSELTSPSSQTPTRMSFLPEGSISPQESVSKISALQIECFSPSKEDIWGSVDKTFGNLSKKFGNITMQMLWKTYSSKDSSTKLDQIQIIGESILLYQVNALKAMELEWDMEESEVNIHPLDRVALLYLLADHFLRQGLSARLSKCRFALPLVLPTTQGPEFFFSSLRGIEEKTISEASGEAKEMPLIEVPFIIVGFLRIGDISVSKSLIASKVLNSEDESHCRFLSMGELSKPASKLLSLGMIDFSWDIKSNLCVLNLHGCACGLHFQKQVRFLLESSNIVCVCADLANVAESHSMLIADLSKRITNRQKMLLINCGSEESHKNQELTTMTISSSNIAAKTQDMRTTFGTMKYEKKTLKSLCKIAQKNNLAIDEELDEDIQKARKSYEKLCEGLGKVTKRDIICLQLNEVDKTKLSKELKRKEIVGEVEETQSRLAEIKRKNADYVHSILSFSDSKCFIFKLVNTLKKLHSTNPKQLLLFFSCMKTELVARNKRLALELKGNNGDEDFFKAMRENQFNVEELMREMAILHTTFQNMDKRNAFSSNGLISKIPEIAAKQLIQGVPLEIMDGDAGAVYVEWLDSVFTAVRNELGKDHKIMILSVLGVQSSGKSTLFNTMFGLDFSVSSGRCTRGIYCQLISVKKIKKIPADFILLLDTEGLRAPELKNAHEGNLRDNELATLVVGIADLTIINIMGETDSEINDTLQITVHAILRMKQVQLNPNCMFVHQNVNDEMIFENTAQARRNLQQNLDTAACDAAYLENCAQKVQGFKDVIQFDYQDRNQVWYLPSLFSGSRISAKYAAKVGDLREAIFTKLSELGDAPMRLSEFMPHVKSLWNAIMTEDFVFSFKNAREVRAYRSLTSKMQKWEWDLHQHGMEWERRAANKIVSADRSALNDLDREFEQEINISMSDQLSQHILPEFTSYFQNPAEANVLVQWKETQRNRLEALKDEIVAQKAKTCREKISFRKSQSLFEEQREQFELKMTKKAEKILERTGISQNLSPEELTTEFESCWKELMEEVSKESGYKKPQMKNIEGIVNRSFHKIFGYKIDKIYSEAKQKPCKGGIDELQALTPKEWCFIVKQTGLAGVLKSAASAVTSYNPQLTKELMTDIKNVLTNTKNTILAWVESCNSEVKAIDEAIPQGLFKSIKEELDGFESTKKKFYFEPKFLFTILYEAYTSACKTLTEAQDKYVKEYDVITSFDEKYKWSFCQLFKMKYSGTKASLTISKIISKHIETGLRKIVNDSARVILVDLIMQESDIPKNKPTIVSNILLKLGDEIQADKSKIKDFELFFRHPYNEMKEYLKKLLAKYWLENRGRFDAKFNEKFMSITSKLVNIIRNANVEDVITKKWFELVQDKINESGWVSLKIPINLLLEVDFSQCTEDEIKLAIISQLETFSKLFAPDLFDEALKLKNEETFKCVFDEAFKLLLETKLIIGCTTKCPFCGVFCELSSADHSGMDHSSSLHWPSGLNAWHLRGSRVMVHKICTEKVAMKEKKFRVFDFLIPAEIRKTIKNKDEDYYHEYTKYKEIHKNWSIIPDLSIETCAYWKWFLANYNEDLAKLYGLVPAKIPEAWKQVSWAEARKSIADAYNVRMSETIGSSHDDQDMSSSEESDPDEPLRKRLEMLNDV